MSEGDKISTPAGGGGAYYTDGMRPMPASPFVFRVDSGGCVDLMAPDHQEFTLDDISLGLSRLPRWAGQSGARVISVLEHSLVVGKLAHPDRRLAALLHDAPEAFTGDLPRPLRAALAEEIGPAFTGALRRIEMKLMRAICRRVLIDFYPGDAVVPEGLWAAADDLAGETFSASVASPDNEALRLEWHHPSPQSLMHYPILPPDIDELRARWKALLQRLLEARLARSPGDRPRSSSDRPRSLG